MEKSNPVISSKDLPWDFLQEEFDPAMLYDGLMNRVSDSPKAGIHDLFNTIDVSSDSELNFNALDGTKDVDNPILDKETNTVQPSGESKTQLLNKGFRYNAKQRKERIERYQSKRNQRSFTKQIKYECRKTHAESRRRIKGRFVKNNEMVESSENQWRHMEKKKNVHHNDIWLNCYDVFLENLIPKHYKTSTSSSLKDLQRCWVIETLAEHRDVDITILAGLISRVSDSPEGFWARERLALRHLEDLLCIPDFNITNLSSLNFHVSELAINVHHCILEKMTTSNPTSSTLESSKMVLQQFILQKRARLPKCALQRLKESILEGDYPSPINMSRLDREHKKNKSCAVQTGCFNAVSRRLYQDTDGVDIQASRLNLAQLVPENAENSLHGNLHANIWNSSRNEMIKLKHMQSLDGNGICFDGAMIHEHSTNRETHPKNEISSLIIPKNMDETMDGDSSEVIVISSKRKSSDNSEGLLVDHLDDDEQFRNVKKLKECGELNSTRQNVDPLVLNEETLSVAEQSTQHSPQTADWAEISLCIMCNRGGKLFICCGSNCPIVVHESCLGSSASFDDMSNSYCPFCSLSQATAAHKEMKQNLSLAKEKADLARNDLLRFVHLLNMNQGNQTCEKLPTESFSPSRIDAHVNFLDETFCNRQLKEIGKSQLSNGREHQQEEAASECCNPLNKGSPSFLNDERIGDTNQNQGNDTSLEPLEPYSMLFGDGLLHRDETTTLCRSDEQNQDLIATEEGKQIGSAQCDTCNSDSQEGPVAETNYTVVQRQTVNSPQSWSPWNANAAEIPMNSPYVDAEVLFNRQCADVEIGNAALEQNANSLEMSPISPFLQTMGISNTRSYADTVVNAGEICANLPMTDTVVRNKQHTGKRRENAVLQRQLVISADGPCGVHGEEASKNENDGYTSFELKKHKFPVMPWCPELACSIPKRKPWTFEEVEKLKEGVEKFAISDDKNIPWHKILEFGRGVFSESRNASALRDRWRRFHGLFQTHGMDPGPTSRSKQKKTNSVVPFSITTRAQARSSQTRSTVKR